MSKESKKGLSPRLTGILGLLLIVIGYVAFDRVYNTPADPPGQKFDDGAKVYLTMGDCVAQSGIQDAWPASDSWGEG